MPDVLGGLLAKRRGPTNLGAAGMALNYLNPINAIKLGLIDPLMAGGEWVRRGVETGEVYPGETLGAATMGISGGVLGPRGAVGSGGGRLPPGAKLTPEQLAKLYKAKPDKNSLLGKYPTTTIGRIQRKTREGGYSVHLPSGKEPTEGLMVGVNPNTSPKNVITEGPLTRGQVQYAERKNRGLLSKEEEIYHMGGWFEDQTGLSYLEVSKKFDPGRVRAATKYGERTGQKSLYDVGARTVRPIGNFREFIAGAKTPRGIVPYARRLLKMNDEGAAYMAEHPNPKWWLTPNMDRVYGLANRPQRTGFLGATSTNTDPLRNVQAMTEYQRRAIKGEPIIQPAFRAPDDMLGGVAIPGNPMPLEAGRSADLLKASRGERYGYGGDVVQEKVDVMSGAEKAVLDRIQTRLGEHPKSGILAQAQEGKSPPTGFRSSDALPKRGDDRQLMQDAIAEQANVVGMDIRDFSANVWAGIRERVKRTGKLFGTPLPGTQRATQRMGESKSYDDHFMDLVRAKAGKLGISVMEMERRLRAGDASLLSFLLATPFVADAFSDDVSGDDLSQ